MRYSIITKHNVVQYKQNYIEADSIDEAKETFKKNMGEYQKSTYFGEIFIEDVFLDEKIKKGSHDK